MKTFQNLKATSLLTFIAAFLFSLTSCQKDELPTVSNSTSEPVDLAMVVATQYDMIILDHSAGMSDAPDYSVTIKTNGKIIFQGRKNTLLEGEWAFAASKDQMLKITDIMKASNFYKIDTEKENEEVAILTFSYNPNAGKNVTTKIALDQQKNDLNFLANQIEGVLGIPAYISEKY
jgi:hypothetical protein